MNVQWLSLDSDGRIPVDQAHRSIPGAANRSPGISWAGVPSGTQSYALSLIDIHPIARNWVHWAIVNIPAEQRELREGISGHQADFPVGAQELVNSYWTSGYGGPKPPRGSGLHRYILTLYALSTPRITVDRDDEWGQALAKIRPYILASAQAEGTFEQ